MRKQVKLDLDMTLVGEAAVVLATEQGDETLHAALRGVVDSRKRRRLPDLDLDLTLEQLHADRRPA